VYLDARGYVAIYMGNHWLKYAEKNNNAHFWITWNGNSKLKAELVGIDERISIKSLVLGAKFMYKLLTSI
ncbi:MAG: hypothetical protein ACTSSP_12925, partial [Candidatus Asgardarchaeia archaeon]